MEKREKFTRKCSVAFIGCSKIKAKTKCKASLMYHGSLFRHSLYFAQHSEYNLIFILSAEYGLIDLEKEIEPYDKTLNNMILAERKAWADKVNNKCKELNIIEADMFAGKKYYEFLNIKKNIFFKSSIGYLLYDLKLKNKSIMGLKL